MNLPFKDNCSTRTFAADVAAAELKWHWDEEDRLVTPLHETDWLFQYDNKLPQPLAEGVSFFIPAGTWHRLHKGTGSLSLNILKNAQAKS